MSLLISLVILLVVVSLLIWLVQSAPLPAGPMTPLIKWALVAIIVIFAIFYLLKYVPGFAP